MHGPIVYGLFNIIICQNFQKIIGPNQPNATQEKKRETDLIIPITSPIWHSYNYSSQLPLETSLSVPVLWTLASTLGNQRQWGRALTWRVVMLVRSAVVDRYIFDHLVVLLLYLGWDEVRDSSKEREYFHTLITIVGTYFASPFAT